MLWSSIRGDRSLEAIARHDLVLLGAGSLGLEFDRQPTGLAEGFTPKSVEKAREKVAAIRRLRPGVVLLGEIYFYEWSDRWLPEDHPWWLRRDGKREQFWPGTHRMDWYNYLFSDNTSHHHDWYPEYDVKIGRPAGPGESLGSHAWRRRYDKALVEVNLPGAREASRVVLETESTDVLSGEKGKVFVIPAGDGRIILLR